MQVKNFHPSQLQWVPVSDRDKDGGTGEIVRVGQLVSSSNMGNGTAGDRWGTGGVSNHMPAAGVGNITEGVIIDGIVHNTNNQTRVLSTLADFLGIEQITATNTLAEQAARAVSQHGGHWPQGELNAMVQIVLLTPYTSVRVNLYNSTRGTAITVNTVTTGSSTGVGFTSDACDVAPVANLSTSYCRKGLNKGLMRQRTDASTTVATFSTAFPHAIAVGDQFVTVPLRPYGLSFPQLDAEADFFDDSATPATNHMLFHVHELHLETPGEEYVIGTFDLAHFCAQISALD